MTNPWPLFDAYSLQARLYPALITAFPGLLVLVACFPTLLSNTGSAFVSVLAACGIFYLLAHIARSKGKQIEGMLLKEWGGWPTTAWLRHSNNKLPSQTKARYHRFLRQKLDVEFPTAAVEASQPAQADSIYESATHWLKEQCRGTSFPLVEKENTSYGFRRNLLGLKIVGLIVSVLAFFVLIIVALKRSGAHGFSVDTITAAYSVTTPAMMGAAAITIIAIITWISLVRQEWVREAGDQYARALLACCDSL